MPGARRGDRWVWLACLTAGVLVLIGCALPTVAVGQDAIIGAGDTQRGFEYDRSVRFATYLEPGAMLFVVGAAALVLLAVIALARGSTPVLVVAAAVLSLALVIEVVRVADELDWPDGRVSSCEKRRLEDCIPTSGSSYERFGRGSRSLPARSYSSRCCSCARFRISSERYALAASRTGSFHMISASSRLSV